MLGSDAQALTCIIAIDPSDFILQHRSLKEVVNSISWLVDGALVKHPVVID
jgi:hypothetical protein